MSLIRIILDSFSVGILNFKNRNKFFRIEYTIQTKAYIKWYKTQWYRYAQIIKILDTNLKNNN